MKGRTLLGLFLLIFSIIIVIGLGIAIGFYKQIVATGFIPDALFFFVGFLAITGIFAGIVICATGEDM